MLYFTALSFFFLLVGLVTGYVFGELLTRQQEYLTLSRKTLERLLVESNITEEILENKQSKEDLEG